MGMNEVTEVGAKAKGNKRGKKSGGEGNASIDGQIGRMLVRAIWAQEWSLANPDGKGEARKAAWKEARTAALEKNLKTYRRAIGSLQRSGVTMALSAEAAGKSDEDDDSEE
jgi:hypothetical protein